MAPSVIVSFVLVALGLQLTEVTGLRCHCDFCPGKNNTCVTDGFCLSLTWLQRETGIIHHAYRCLDRKMFFLKPYPTQCSLSNVPNIEVRTACCSRDMCNLHLTPRLEGLGGLEVAGEPLSDEWLDRRPRTGTLLVNNNATRRWRFDGKTAPTGPPPNFINCTEQADE